MDSKLTQRQKTAVALREHEAATEDVEREYLVAHGWKYTSDTPGCFWLWRKQLPTGETALCPPGTAIAMERALSPDDDASYYGDRDIDDRDGDQGEAADTCP